jgi:hypothetical protein
MFSDEVEAMMCTEANQLLFAASAFSIVAIFVYGLWGVVRVSRTTWGSC